MNNYFIFFCLLFSSFAIAQPSIEELQKDTAEANRLYFESETLDHTNPQRTELVKQAIILYKKHGFISQTIQLQSVLAYHYLMIESDEVIKVGAAAIQLAKDEFQSDSITDLGNIYWALQTYWYNIDDKQSIHFGEKALNLLPKYTYIYYDAAYMLMDIYVKVHRINRLEHLNHRLEQELEIVANSEEIPETAFITILYGRYLIHVFNGNYQYMINYGKQLITEITKYELESDYYLGGFYIQIGKALGELGEIEEGITWIEEGMKVEGLEEESPYRGLYYAYIADLQYDKDDFEVATTTMKKAIAAYKIEEEKNGGAIRDISSELAMWYLDKGQDEEALEYLESAYRYENSNSYLTDIQYGRWLKRQQKFDEALEYLQKAIIATSSDAFTSVESMTNPSKYDEFPHKLWGGRALFEKSLILYEQGKSTQSIETLMFAASTAELAIEVFMQLYQKTTKHSISRLKNSEAITKAFRVLQSIYQLLYQISPNNYTLNDAFQITEKSKALLLLETINSSETAVSKEYLEEEANLISAIKSTEQKMAFEQDEAKLKTLQNTMFAYLREIETHQQEVGERFPNYIKNIQYTTYTDLSTLQSNIATNAIWLEYSFDHEKNQLLIYTINQNSTKIVTVVVPNNLENNIKILQKSLNDPFMAMAKKRLEFIELSHQLHKILITPIQQDLEGIEQIHIVPDKILFQFPFEVLLASDKDKPYQDLDYLIKKKVINYHYSATSYIALKDKKTPNDYSLLAFAPVFAEGQAVAQRERSILGLQDSLYRSLDSGRYKALPNSEREIKIIGQTIEKLGKTQLLLKEQATKENLLNALTAQPYQFIHIASHGIVNYKKPNYAALVCHQKLNDKTSSSLLFLDEIQMNKIEVDLVILSSCESGVGRLVQGEGLIGLNRSFLLAGAKNVLFSLWKVDDKYTSDLMIKFYKTYTTNKSYANALRLAKLEMISNEATAIPNYWASFILIGN